MSGHTPWGVEQAAEMLWVGPMRSDGEKVNDAVVGLSYDRDLTHAAKVRQQERARLIASAPDLLEALQLLLNDYVALAEENGCDLIGSDRDPEVRRARAAISKARGEA